MTLERVARGWRPCISGSVVDSSERGNGSDVSAGEKAYESFRCLVLESQDGLERHIVFYNLGRSEPRLAKIVRWIFRCKPSDGGVSS